MDTQNLLGIKIKEIMTTNLLTVKPDSILKEANILFERENIHHVPVVDDSGKFMGIISKSDILLLMDWGTKLKLPASMRKNTFLLTSNLAKDVMETNVIKLAPDDDVRKCVQIFRENYFHALPIVDENEVLLGLVTTYDLMILAYTHKPMLHA